MLQRKARHHGAQEMNTEEKRIGRRQAEAVSQSMHPIFQALELGADAQAIFRLPFAESVLFAVPRPLLKTRLALAENLSATCPIAHTESISKALWIWHTTAQRALIRPFGPATLTVSQCLSSIEDIMNQSLEDEDNSKKQYAPTAVSSNFVPTLASVPPSSCTLHLSNF